MDLTDINDIRELLARHGFRFSKSKGQNFLCRSWVPERIVREAGLDGDTGVLEIGPGIGCLTAELSRACKKVVSVELDEALRGVLAETLEGCDNVEIVYGDILKLDLEKLVSEHFGDCGSVAVCANLPYNITSPVLTALINCGSFESITVMIQREVAHRICAAEGSKDYSAFSVFVQWHAGVRLLFDVSPDCFIPAPKVHSSVIRLDMREKPPFEASDEKLMLQIVRAAFNQRRKTLANALSNTLRDYPKAAVLGALSALSLSETVRGEALSLSQFAALADELKKRG